MPLSERLSDEDCTMIEAGGAFTVVPEEYGFSVRPGPAARRRATMVEWAAQYMAFLTIFATVGAVASSAGLSGEAVDIFEAGIVALGFGVAAAFFWVGTRGTALELQVDTYRRQFRTAIRNWRGSERIMEIHDFNNVESAFVHRRTQRERSARFCVRTRSEPEGVEMITGDPTALGALHEVLARSLRASQRPVTKERPIPPRVARAAVPAN